MLSINELNEIRDRVRQNLTVRKFEGEVKLIISSGTTAIACGSRQLMSAAMDEMARVNAAGIQLKQMDMDIASEDMPAMLIVAGDEEVLVKKATVEQVKSIIRERAQQKTAQGEA